MIIEYNLNESALDDIGQDVYDDNFVDIKNNMTPYDMYMDFAEDVYKADEAPEMYECMFELKVGYEKGDNRYIDTFKKATVDVDEAYKVIFEAFNNSENIFKHDKSQEFPFVIYPPYIHEPNMPEFKPQFEFPLPTELSIAELYKDQRVSYYFYTFTYLVYFNKLRPVQYKYFYKMFNAFQKILFNINTVLNKKENKCSVFGTLYKKYPDGDFKKVDDMNRISIPSDMKLASFYNMICYPDTKYEFGWHMNSYDFEGTGEKVVKERYKTECDVLNNSGLIFANKAVKKGFPIAKEKYGIELSLQFQMMDPRTQSHCGVNTRAIIIVNAKKISGDKKISLINIVKCICECVVDYIDLKIIHHKKVMVIVNSDFQYTTYVTTNKGEQEIETETNKYDIENYSFNVKYYWRIQEVSMKKKVYSHNCYIILTNKQGTLGLKSHIGGDYGYDRIIRNTVDDINFNGFSKVTQAYANAEFKKLSDELKFEDD